MAKLPNAVEQVKGDKVGHLVVPEIVVEDEPANVVVESVEVTEDESVEVEESVTAEDLVELIVPESVEPTVVVPVQDATLTSTSQTI